MHPAPSLAEAPPNNEESRNGSNLPASPESQASPREQLDRHNGTASPPVRKDTISSTATTATTSSVATITSNGTAATALSIESPTHSYNGSAVFSVMDSDNQPHRRPSRRRTRPLSAEQRDRAALIRKLRACPDCRRRRVAVSMHSSHHDGGGLLTLSSATHDTTA